EARAPGRLPRDHVALAVGQRHDRIVKRGLDVGLPDRNVLANPPAASLRSARSWHLLLGRLLLAGDLHPLRALARARVGLGVLTMDREPAMRADLLKPLDVLRAPAPQVALDREVLVDQLAQLDDLFLGEVAHFAVGLDAELGEHLVGRRATDPVDVRQTDLNALVEGDVDTRNACHLNLAFACDADSSRS